MRSRSRSRNGHGDYDAKNDPKFAKTSTFGNGQMLVRNDGTAREIIVLHTDIDAPVAHRFGTTASGYAFDVDVDTDTSANDSYAVQATDASKLGRLSNRQFRSRNEEPRAMGGHGK